MAGLKGLKKGARPEIEKQAENFIKGANDRVTVHSSKEESKQTYKRLTFSLTENVSNDIDKLSLTPRDFKVSRSDVVKAGIALLKSLPEEEQVATLRNAKKHT